MLPDEDYRFQLGLRPIDAAEFFRPGSGKDELLRQRRKWLSEEPARYAAALPGAEPLIDAATAFGKSIGSLPRGCGGNQDALTASIELGMNWEPDFLLMRGDPDGVMRLVAGAVCFPSSWSLEEKIGRPMDMIHAVVPGLNATLGRQINTALKRLKTSKAWGRSNWGLTASAELNQHPARKLPRLAAHPEPSEVWLRVEHQALVALQAGVLLFAIRIEVHRFQQIQRDPILAPRLARALATMPQTVAQYKGLSAAQTWLCKALQRGATEPAEE